MNSNRIIVSTLFFAPLICFSLIVIMLTTEEETPIVFSSQPVQQIDLKEVVIVGNPSTDGKIRLIKVRKFIRENGSARKPLKSQEKSEAEKIWIKVPKSDMMSIHSPSYKKNQEKIQYQFEVK